MEKEQGERKEKGGETVRKRRGRERREREKKGVQKEGERVRRGGIGVVAPWQNTCLATCAAPGVSPS